VFVLKALYRLESSRPVLNTVDCLTSNRLVRLPGMCVCVPVCLFACPAAGLYQECFCVLSLSVQVFILGYFPTTLPKCQLIISSFMSCCFQCQSLHVTVNIL